MRSDFLLSFACVLGLAVLSGGGAVAQTGALTQLPGTDACVSEDGLGGACADGVALELTRGVAVSPDGRNVYVASLLSSAVAAFTRDRRTGALTQLPGTDACVSEDGTGGDCTDGVGLEPVSVTVSRDGRNVYVASPDIDAVAAFTRDRQSGALTQLLGTDACVSQDGTGGDCAEGVGLDGPVSVAVSPDGRNVYVASTFSDVERGPRAGAVAVFARDRRTGVLTQLPGTDACVSEDGTGGDCADGVALDFAFGVTVSPDGRNVYVASFLSNAVAVFARDRRTGALTQLAGTDACISEDGTGGACADGVALDGARSVAVSPDGRSVYVTSQLGDAVAVFARDRKTGALTQLPGTDACVSEDGTGGACAEGVALDGAFGVTVSPDGRNVYVASSGSGAVAALARDRRTGALTQLPGTEACVGGGGECADGIAIGSASTVAVSSDGRNVYVGSLFGNEVAVFARDRDGPSPAVAR